MTRPRFRAPKPFNKRSKESQSMNAKKSFFIICEGEKTEKQYFKGIFNNRIKLDIHQLIDIKVIDQIGTHIPHPLHLARACKWYFEKDINDDSMDIEDALFKSEDNEFDLSDYDETIDEIWLVFDRDPQTLFKNQYEEIEEICQQFKLNIGLTNPNFEFWLLLHLPDINQYNHTVLLKNRKIGGKNSKRYIEKELVNRLENGYSKNDIHFEEFIDRIDHAIDQEKLFEIIESNIFDNLGSNIGVLITKMKED